MAFSIVINYEKNLSEIEDHMAIFGKLPSNLFHLRSIGDKGRANRYYR